MTFKRRAHMTRETSRAGRHSILSLLLCCWPLGWLVGCGEIGNLSGVVAVAMADAKPTPPTPWSPDGFRDDLYAEIASSGSTAWFVEVGLRRGDPKKRNDIGARLYRLNRPIGSWRELPRIRDSIDPDQSIDLAISTVSRMRGVPCLGYTSSLANITRVKCLIRGVWTQLHLTAAMRRAGHLFGFDGSTHRLVAAFSDRRGSGAVARVFVRGRRSRSWVRAADPLVVEPGLLGLGRSASNALSIGFEDGAGERSVLTSQGFGWQRRGSVISDVGVGPFVSGPIQVGKSTFFPAVDTDRSPWEYSVFAATRRSRWHRWHQLGGSPLNRGSGNAQGSIDLLGNDVWASWQENAIRADGLFGTKVFAARLDRNGVAGSRIRVWRGVTIGPGPTGVSEIDGRILVLYVRGAPSGGLRATVEGLGARSSF